MRHLFTMPAVGQGHALSDIIESLLREDSWVGRHCRRRERPAWQLLLGSRDFGAIMLLNAMMFMTQNGSRAVLVPLLATQAFGVTTTTLGDLRHYSSLIG